MTVITLDVIQTVGLAVIVFVVGRYIKSKVSFFQKYFIPAPVIGGIICSLIIFAGVRGNFFTVKMNGVGFLHEHIFHWYRFHVQLRHSPEKR